MQALIYNLGHLRESAWFFRDISLDHRVSFWTLPGTMTYLSGTSLERPPLRESRPWSTPMFTVSHFHALYTAYSFVGGSINTKVDMTCLTHTVITSLKSSSAIHQVSWTSKKVILYIPVTKMNNTYYFVKIMEFRNGNKGSFAIFHNRRRFPLLLIC